MSKKTLNDDSGRMDAFASLAHMHLHDDGRSTAKHAFPAIILGALFVALLLALIAGVIVYKYITDTQSQANVARESIGLICNAVRANDAEDAIAVGQGPEGRSLVIVEKLDSGTFETRFYLCQGEVLQEYSLAGSPYTPEKANQVAESSSFDFDYSHDLLSVSTDQGTAEIALRSLQGGE